MIAEFWKKFWRKDKERWSYKIMEYKHTPVMLKEVLASLNPKPAENYIDCTLGGGGYTEAIIKRILPDGKVLAIDLDETAIANAEKKFKIEIKNKNIILSHENFKNLQKIVDKDFSPAALFNGIVLDLGLSSAQLSGGARGFSFNLDEPLGMNFGGQVELRAEEIINSWSAEDLEKIFREYGEEKFARKIALAITERRKTEKIKNTGQLVEIILKAVPKKFQTAGQRNKIHPATRVFQALRIAVNDELGNLREVLPQAVNLLKSGGKICVISYHSLEDRIVKQFFKKESIDCLCPPAAPICQCGHKASLKIITRGVLRPTEEEVLKNPRARSAKLRLAMKK